ncbi:TPA: hypothetical protein DDW69_04915 [candidate division CPR2 bacterium]|uniref:Uncharacterized protein n=1 Tax=candidate division CPR2 bacterium GW2011_GWC1_41_48 TaxID=1618344 RepID=A0A0G0YIL2_UNCC2|nr:MAG: hypothetical protein UT47_C0002G0140 [candidate division CPR2 bacterium GW2011_GWC2_39_35]KKS09386.1 MAG: hypothetical protein UU65_C0002G0164 [candidate division CPR2 bacterium GW2011_GWC1_41_48]HBG82142.1 hypothetical protein [candidate division CPR2 bacterium]
MFPEEYADVVDPLISDEARLDLALDIGEEAARILEETYGTQIPCIVMQAIRENAYRETGEEITLFIEMQIGSLLRDARSDQLGDHKQRCSRYSLLMIIYYVSNLTLRSGGYNKLMIAQILANTISTNFQKESLVVMC